MLYTKPPQDTSGYVVIIFHHVSVATNHFWDSVSIQYIFRTLKIVQRHCVQIFLPNVAHIGQETRTQGRTLNDTLSTARLQQTDRQTAAAQHHGY
jgi:hypothetical protein